ncbi:MAG: FliM/FliN family flagellar motor switch protein [Eubacteriales bacterium]|nr:FliM/FliN family flagellar motor switch protein [Eubacteriales bacterium]MDD3199258.1 FliM/FliN family flagellar motor switch protein [Eubacteriales bacterium]MDD4122285.1 FliM/FliN family flagellar motor switch protein [Eubacteriales bacterium]MDD4629388.1 FliM/FliN family flagellar motor switch protein [Eubacteriales bacterium]
MSEILSQSQIDSLLSSLASGNQEIEPVEKEKGKKIKNYDFRSPKLFTREQLKLLYSIYENYARILSSYITGILQTYSLVEIIEVEEQQYYEFNNALPDSVLIGLVDLAIKENNDEENLILVDLSKDIGYCCIDKLLGGSGKPLEADREFTEIELGILDHMMKGIVNLMKNIWIDYLEVKPRLLKLETNSRILQGIGADDNVVIIVMNIMVNETHGKMNICIPAITLDAIFKMKDALSKKKERRGDQLSDAQRRTDILKQISQSDLEVKGILGSIEVLSKDLIGLEVGDIIKLNKPENSLVELAVGETVWFRGEMGSYNKKRAIAIRESVKRGSDLKK